VNPIAQFDSDALSILPTQVWSILTIYCSILSVVAVLVYLFRSPRYRVEPGDYFVWKVATLGARIGLGILAFSLMLSVFQAMQVFPNSSPREAIGFLGLSMFLMRNAVVDVLHVNRIERVGLAKAKNWR
jgi:hypothetical protein